MDHEENATNPFAPVQGADPLVLAGREDVIASFSRALSGNPGDSGRLLVISGTRGSGKSALLAAAANQARKQRWIAICANARDTLLSETLQLAALEMQKMEGRADLNELITFCDSAADRLASPESSIAWRTAICALLNRLGSHCQGLLLCIDDARDLSNGLREILEARTYLVGEGRNIAIALTTLPQQLKNLIASPLAAQLAFADVQQLNDITPQQIEEALQKTAESHGRRFSANALVTAVRNSGSSPQRMQLIGYHAWNQNPEGRIISIDDVNHGVRKADEQLDRFISQGILASLSAKDLAYLRAMAQDDGVSLVSDVAQRMNVAANYARIYKKRLTDAGLISSAGRGKVAFEVPELRDYLRQDRA